MGKLKSRSSTVDRQMGNHLLEDLLREKTLDLESFKGAKPMPEKQLSLRQVSDRAIATGKPFKISKVHPEDLDSLSEEHIKAEISNLMGLAMSPGTSENDQEAQDEILSGLQKQVVKKPSSLHRRE